MTLGATRGRAVQRFALQLPPGASLHPIASEQGQRELVSDILVKDKSGYVIGVIDSPWAQDASGNSLFTFFQIEGRTLVQTIDASDAGTQPVIAVLMYAGSQTNHDEPNADPEHEPHGMVGPTYSTYVGIPTNYVYQPSLGSLHDYCTSSPDEFPNPAGANANFRGPCARHDLCYGGTTDKKICDVNLREHMRMNCRHSYAWYNPARAACYTTADVYFLAVVAAS